jgi:hypothetical protein
LDHVPHDRPAADLHQRLRDRLRVLLQPRAAPATEDYDRGPGGFVMLKLDGYIRVSRVGGREGESFIAAWAADEHPSLQARRAIKSLREVCRCATCHRAIDATTTL